MPAAPVVLDSYALLAYFRGEESGARVRDLLDRAAAADRSLHLSDVNYAELKYIILRKDGLAAWGHADEVLKSLPVEFVSTNRAMADRAADFKARYTISLADAFAAALCKEKRGELVTGDPEFKQLESEIRIAWLR